MQWLFHSAEPASYEACTLEQQHSKTPPGENHFGLNDSLLTKFLDLVPDRYHVIVILAFPTIIFTHHHVTATPRFGISTGSKDDTDWVGSPPNAVWFSRMFTQAPVVLVVEVIMEVVDVVDVLGMEDEEASGSCSCVGSGSGSLQMPCSVTGAHCTGSGGGGPRRGVPGSASGTCTSSPSELMAQSL